MQRIFFTSDTHYWHDGIRTLGRGRPFDSMEAMNEALVENHNATVSKSDLIYHLGDFSWANAAKTEEVLRRLNGSIHLIKGNHDGSLATVVKRNPKLVASFQSYKEIRVDQQRLVLFHFPILSWHQVHYGSWHLHGHCHGNLDFDNGPMLDVGVDVHGFRPIEFDEIATLMKDRSPRLWDHHTTDDGRVGSRSAQRSAWR